MFLLRIGIKFPKPIRSHQSNYAYPVRGYFNVPTAKREATGERSAHSSNRKGNSVNHKEKEKVRVSRKDQILVLGRANRKEKVKEKFSRLMSTRSMQILARKAEEKGSVRKEKVKESQKGSRSRILEVIGNRRSGLKRRVKILGFQRQRRKIQRKMHGLIF